MKFFTFSSSLFTVRFDLCMDRYSWMDRVYDHVHILQEVQHRSDHCGNLFGINFILWTFLEFLLCRLNDIQMLHTREGISYEYEVLHYHSGRKKSSAGLAGRHHPNSCLQGIIA